MKALKFIEYSLSPNVTSFRARVCSSFLVILTAVGLFSHKFIWWEFENNFGFGDTATFVWMVSILLCPMIAIFLGLVFKPFKTSYLVYVYLYTVQLYWLFSNQSNVDDYLLHVYATGAVAITIFLGYVISKAKMMHDRSVIEANERIRLNEQKLEILKNDIYKKTA